MLVFEVPNILVVKMFKCFGRLQKVRLLQKNKIRQVFVEIGVQIFKFFPPFRGKSIRVPREERERKRGGKREGKRGGGGVGERGEEKRERKGC